MDKSCALEHVTRDRVRGGQRRRPPTRIHLKEVRLCPQLGQVGGQLSLGLQLLRMAAGLGTPPFPEDSWSWGFLSGVREPAGRHRCQMCSGCRGACWLGAHTGLSQSQCPKPRPPRLARASQSSTSTWSKDMLQLELCLIFVQRGGRGRRDHRGPTATGADP